MEIENRHLVNKCLLGHAQRRGRSDCRLCHMFPPSYLAHILCHYYLWWYFPSWNRSYIYIILGSCREGQRFFLSIVSLDCFQIEIIPMQKRHFWNCKFCSPTNEFIGYFYLLPIHIYINTHVIYFLYSLFYIGKLRKCWKNNASISTWE